MFLTVWLTPQLRRLCLASLVILVLILSSSCSQSPAVTYSIEEQYNLARARMPSRQDQLKFSFQLERDQIPVGQDIFFTATFTNTVDQPIVFRDPYRQGVMELVYPDTTLFFTVEPITGSALLDYPLLHALVERFYPKIEQLEFLTLPPHGSCEIRLQLPHMLGDAFDPPDQYPLPPGKYRVQMTYMNDSIGYQVKQDGWTRYVDLNAWVGEVQATNPISFTIAPGK